MRHNCWTKMEWWQDQYQNPLREKTWVCLCVREQNWAPLCRRRSVERKKVVESSGRRVPTGYHHFIAQCSVVPPGLELIGARLTFQWDITTPSNATYLWISDIGRGWFPRHALQEIIWSWTVWLPLQPKWDKNNMLLKMLPGCYFCLCSTIRSYRAPLWNQYEAEKKRQLIFNLKINK